MSSNLRSEDTARFFSGAFEFWPVVAQPPAAKASKGMRKK